jgi:hypothetical protein
MQSGESAEGSSRWTDTLRALLTPETIDLAVSTGRDVLSRAATLPARVDSALTKLERGETRVQIVPDVAFTDHLRRIERSAQQIVIGLVFGSLMLSSTLLFISGAELPGVVGYLLSGVTLVVLLARGR